VTRLGSTARRSLALALATGLLCAGVTLGLGGHAGIASGQDRARGGRGARAERETARSEGARSDAARREGARPDAEAGEPDAPETGEGVDAQSREVAEGGEKVKAIRFSGLDVSGRLKAPQLLYFLNRVRAEFDRPRLPHRSFMPELDRSTRSSSF
jgi:hypothetical protein